MCRGGGSMPFPPPPGNFLISDLLRSFLVPFWGEQHELDDLLPNLVIVFERSKNLKAWLRFAPQRLQAAVKPGKKKKKKKEKF